jgi:Carboxypeptidase regulatory-like domain
MGPFLLNAVRLFLTLQTTGATVAGIVRDEVTGTPLASVIVALPDLNRVTTTTSDGRYELPNVPAGPQHITIRFLGYAPRTLHALVPRDGRLEINVSLRPQAFQLPGIEARSPVLVRGVEPGASGAFPDRVTSMAAARNHPLLAEPDAFQAISGGEVVVRTEAPSGLHLRGGASDQTGYLLDGIPIFSPYHAAGVFSAWNPDALARVQIWSAVPSPEFPDALSGTVYGVSRSPGTRLQTMGSVSTMQARLTVDGPLGGGGIGFLLSLRSAFPGMIPHKNEASYIHGESGDWLAKVEAPLLKGRLKLLGYNSSNEITTGAQAGAGDEPTGPVLRHGFEWSSSSAGVEWTRGLANWNLRLLGWSARGDGSATWMAVPQIVSMGSARRDQGVLASAEHKATSWSTLVGLRTQWSRTSYQLAFDSGGSEPESVSTETPIAALFGQYSRSIRPIAVTLATSLAAVDGRLYPAPQVMLQWKLSEQLGLTGSLGRTHQFAQSLRNPESVVGTVFPADLYLGVGAPGIPVARSDQGLIAAEYRPAAGIRFGLQGFARQLDGLVLVAPSDGGPFTMGSFTVGSGTARGIAFDASASTARFGAMASYGYQRVRFQHGELSYAPKHGAAHRLEGGVIIFPSATSSIRLGAAGEWGRRTTAITGGLEWESCNLLDRGCEFSGSPSADTASLGTSLPAYFRVDLSARKHWHFQIGQRDASVALFGTLTNLLGRRNVLTYGVDPGVLPLYEVDMRPRAPFVVGLDWRF